MLRKGLVFRQILFHQKTKKLTLLKIKEKYQGLVKKHESRKSESKYISYEQAKANKLKIDWKESDIYKPSFIGNKYFYDYDLAEISKYIDWTFFFHAWKLNGKYPDIFNDPVKGEEAKKLFQDAKNMLDLIIKEKRLTANGVIGFYPANSIGEDVELYKNERQD